MKTIAALPFQYALAIAALAVSTLTHAQPTHEWTNTSPAPAHVVTDAMGNVYSCGSFQGTQDFDHGVGVYNLTAVGGSDFFVQKTDTDGNLIWAFSIGGTSNDYTRSIKLDASGNVLVCGVFSSQVVDFDPGAGTYNLDGPTDGTSFILKVDGSGNFLWAVNLKVNFMDLTTDVADNVYATGHFSGARDFDPGVGTTTMSSLGSDDIFVLKLNSSGSFVWAKQMGGTQGDKAAVISMDDAENLYLTGTFSGTADFDPGTGTFNLVSNSSTSTFFDDVYITKLNSNGGFIWAKRFDGASYDYAHDMAISGDGNIHVLLELDAPLDVDPGAGVFTITPTGIVDATVVKLDSSGTFTWAKSVTGGLAVPAAIDLDMVGGVYMIGYTDNLSDLDPGAGVYNLSTIGPQGSYVHKLSANGDFEWALGIDDMDGSSASEASGLSVDHEGSIFWSGSYYGSVDLDPTAGTNITTSGTSGTYMQKLGQCEGYGVDVVSSCSPLVWIDGNTYSSSNFSATHTIVAGAASGCDSIVTLNFTLSSASTGTDVQSACGSYTWIDGNTYTASNNTATWTLTNAAGCDSVVTLNLTILSPSQSTDVVSACGSYTWQDGNNYTASNNTATWTLTNSVGCDSVITLDLTILSPTQGTDVITACDSYVWIDGNTYSSSNNTATHTLTNAAGCDSVVTLDLTINSVVNTVTQAGTTLTADENGATYQWLDCPGLTPINGETGQSFTPSTDGNYAVMVTLSGCVDTSSCLPVAGVGIAENDFGATLQIYPNPTQGGVSIDMGDVHENVTIQLMDLTGRILESFEFENGQDLKMSIDAPAGTYMLLIKAEVKQAVVRVVKE